MKQEAKKKKYVSPAIETVHLENEGILASSTGAGINDIENGGTWSALPQATPYATPTDSELENTIHELLN